MEKFSTVLVTACCLLCLFCGSAFAKWSLLEDYQMNDLSGDKGLCFSSVKDMKDECGFDVRKYGVDYPEDELNDDMDEARESGFEMIFYDYSFKHPVVPIPIGMPASHKPVPGEPFFQSDWYTPDFSGWEKLCEEFFRSHPCR